MSNLQSSPKKKIPDFVIKLGRAYIDWVGQSSKWHIEGEEHYLLARAIGKPIIFAFWHNQLMLMPFCYLAATRRTKAATLISRSRDGQVVNDMIESFGFTPIRGSSSRGGSTALLQLTRHLSQGYDLVLTPDGPRGPRYEAQPGVVALASVSGCPILPFACDTKKRKVLKSWDHFRVSYPYNEGALVGSAPIWVNSQADEKHLQEKVLEVQKALDKVNARASYIVSQTRQGTNSTEKAS
jgi:lysophospholipid acyltransferase (LPLAT)-like uncharacterized protein